MVRIECQGPHVETVKWCQGPVVAGAYHTHVLTLGMSRVHSEHLLAVKTPRVLLPDLNKQISGNGKLKREDKGIPVSFASLF